jgi:exonuclease SbcC
MPVRVRVRNFQSIKDAEVTISGLTVITGPNNIGKSALMRAVRGVFTNPPAGPLVRNGTAHLTVDLWLPDGTHIKWEKGWAKPDRKGGTLNQYWLNGMKLESVGRNAPAEILALGVAPISAGNQQLWPQVARQKEGDYFLVNKSGAIVAEALSDVERVGRLNKALRLTDRDRRSTDSELRVRRKDLRSIQKDLELFEGLDDLQQGSESLKGTQRQLEARHRELQKLLALQGRLQEARAQAEYWGAFQGRVPAHDHLSPSRVAEINRLGQLNQRWVRATGRAALFQGFQAEVPGAATVAKMSRARKTLRDVEVRYESSLQRQQLLEGCPVPVQEPAGLPGRVKLLGRMSRLDRQRQEALRKQAALPSIGQVELPSSDRAQRILKGITKLQGFQDRYTDLLRGQQELTDKRKHLDLLLAQAKAEVVTLLGERGECPTCGAVH